MHWLPLPIGTKRLKSQLHGKIQRSLLLRLVRHKYDLSQFLICANDASAYSHKHKFLGPYFLHFPYMTTLVYHTHIFHFITQFLFAKYLNTLTCHKNLLAFLRAILASSTRFSRKVWAENWSNSYDVCYGRLIQSEPVKYEFKTNAILQLHSHVIVPMIHTLIYVNEKFH